jgi:hypothetical protein
MIVWNYRVSYENNLQGTDEMEQILRALQNIIGILLHLCLGLRNINLFFFLPKVFARYLLASRKARVFSG